MNEREIEQLELKKQMLASMTAEWADKETFIEQYISVYGKSPSNSMIKARRYSNKKKSIKV